MENLYANQDLKDDALELNKILQEIDELEGIVNNEPPKNKYETVKFHKLNIFPYFLIGKVVSKFDFDGVNKFLNGVGMLIGPDVVLTVAHNLCHLVGSPQNGKILINKRVCFFAAASGDFNLFEPVKSNRTYIPEEYINALKTDNKEEQLYHDWGLIFLADPVGDSITDLLDIEKSNSLKVVGNLYSFFINNENLNLLNLSQQTKSEKISIVGYTEYKDNYKNNSSYKFLNNFKNNLNIKESNSSINMNTGGKEICDDTINKFNYINKHIGNFNVHQGKIISELVQEGKEFINKEKKININININTTEPESVTEGLITTSRYYHQKMNVENAKISINGLDYIILGNEEYNKDFDVTDVDKLIMSESKGSLIGLSDEILESGKHMGIKYQISTYKGQSGSPIFLRVKRMTDKFEQGAKSKPVYIYQFVGLHSRRGPMIGEKHFYESEKMSSLTENLMTEDDIKRVPKLLGKDIDGNMTNDLVNFMKNNEVVKQNGICEYNMAVSIMGGAIKKIKMLVHEHFSSNLVSANYCTPSSIPMFKSEFILAKIFLGDSLRLCGLFKRNVPMSVLFSFGAKIFNVPKEYILLKDQSNPDGLSISNYNYDHNKKLSDIMEDPENVNVISFELMLNIKKYGEFISNNIIQKYLENYDLEINKLKQDFKKHLKALFHTIFAEINSFDNIHPTYGKLFKKIRKTILLQLGVTEIKN